MGRCAHDTKRLSSAFLHGHQFQYLMNCILCTSAGSLASTAKANENNCLAACRQLAVTFVFFHLRALLGKAFIQVCMIPRMIP